MKSFICFIAVLGLVAAKTQLIISKRTRTKKAKRKKEKKSEAQHKN